MKKVNIEQIQGALFWWREQYYDLDEECCYAVADIKLEENWCDLNLIRIPLYSIAPICQQYFDFLMSERELEDKYGLATYPRFELGERTCERAIEEEYILKARNFFDEVQSKDIWKYETCTPNPGWYSGFPYYREFEKHVTRKFAKKWCEEQGYEWYEKEALVPMLTPDKIYNL